MWEVFQCYVKKLWDKVLKEKDAVKNSWDGVAGALELLQNGNYFYVYTFNWSFLKTSSWNQFC